MDLKSKGRGQRQRAGQSEEAKGRACEGLAERGREDVDETYVMKVRGRKKKVCEDCMEELEAQSEVEAEAESAVRDMMEYKGGW